MKLVKRANDAAPLDDAAIAQRLETIVGRGKIETHIDELRQAVPSERG